MGEAPTKAWTKLLGGASADYANSVSTANDGSIYIAGITYGNLDNNINAGKIDAFLSKYNSDGTKSWTRLLGTSGDDYAYSVTTGSDGSIYIAGGTEGNLDGNSSAGDGDAFLSKYKSDGTKSWTRLLGTSAYDYAYSVTTGSDGSIYIAGGTEGNLDGNSNAGGSDAFLSKYNSDGTKSWTRLLGTSGDDPAKSVTTGSDGSIYIAGITQGNLDGNSNAGIADAFLSKYNSDGTKSWTRLLGSSASDGASSVTTGSDGSIYIAGITYGKLDGNSNDGSADAFLSKYNSDGTKSWTRLLGSSVSDEAYSVTTGSDGSIYIAGITSGKLDGNSNAGGSDAFLSKYNSDGTKSWTRLLGTYGSESANSVTTGSDGSIHITGVTGGNLDGNSNTGSVDAFLSKFSFPPTYILTPSTTSINEGAVLTNTVTTTNVATGTKLYYALSGTGITTADFYAGALTGEGITDSAGKFTLTHTLANDLTTEGAESLSIKLYSDTARTMQVGTTATVSVVDSSTTAPLVVRGNSLYTIVDGPSWTQAEANSVKLGGHLVTINDAAERRWLSTNLYGNKLHIDRLRNNSQVIFDLDGYFVGLNDKTANGIFQWAGGNATNWVDPSDYIHPAYFADKGYLLNGFEYGAVHSNSDGLGPDIVFNLGDTHSYYANDGIFYRGIAETPFIRRGDSAYVIVSGPNWEEAEANAVKLGGHLVTINDAGENEWILNNIKNLGVEGNTGDAFIGLRRVGGVDPVGDWRWISGETSAYANWYYDPTWGYGQRPNIDNNPGATVGMIYLDYPGRKVGKGFWNDTANEGNVHHNGIAEIKLTPNNTPTGIPTVTGTFKVGSTLTIDATAIKDSDNFTGYTPTFKYNWETSTDGTTWSKLTSTDGADNNNTYILRTTEASKKIRGVVSYLDGYGTNEVVNSVASIIEADTKKPIIRGNSLYTIVDGPSWTQAEANSVKLGGHLTTINNLEENNWITSIIKSVGNAYTSNAWIGFSDAREEGSWSWSSGEISSFTNWGNTGFGNEPNGGVNENFGMIYLDLPLTPTDQWGKWNDADGLGRVGGGISETPFIRRGDSAYVIVQGPTWEEAEANAVKLGGHLVTINDAAENEWLSSQSWNGGPSLYIGYSDRIKEGDWRWADGSSSDITSWSSNEPSNGITLNLANGEDYATVISGSKNWFDISNEFQPGIHSTLFGIAEIKLTPNNTPTGTPTVTGTLKVGSTLTIDATAIKDSDNFTGYTPTFKYNWETSTDGTTWSKLTTTDGVDNNNTYILTAAETSKKIRGVVSYLDGYGTNEVVNSVAIDLEGLMSAEHIKSWTRLLGSSAYDSAHSVTTGIDGSIYIAGFTDGNLDGNSNNGNGDAFLSKYNSDGTKSWTRLLGSSGGYSGGAIALSVTTDIDGTVYIAGYTSGNVDGISNAGNRDAFLSKYNSDGTKSWTRLLGSSSEDYATEVTTGSNGSIYIAGFTEGNLDGNSNAGYSDAFLSKYNSDGTKSWTRLLGSSGYDSAQSVTTGSDGSIYIAGETSGNLDGNSNASSADIHDAFLSKYNSDGTKSWTRLLGTSAYDHAKDVTRGSDGSIYIAGITFGNLDGNSNAGSADAFLSKYNSDGTKSWTRLLGSSSEDNASSVTTGSDGSIYFAGITSGNLDGNSNARSADAFLSKYNSDGTKSWTRLLGTSAYDYATDVTMDSDGTIYIAGSTQGNLDGNSNAGGGSDAFLSKFSFPANKIPTYTLTPSASLINEGAVLTSTVTTTNVATGTKLYYALSGTGITTADFSAGALTGEGITDATGKFTFTHTPANDLLTEGAEMLSIKLYSDTARTVQVGSTATVSVVDSSTTAPLVVRGNSLYTIVDGPSWTQAEANSVKLGGHLATINNQDEHNWVANIYRGSFKRVHIGLTRITNGAKTVNRAGVADGWASEDPSDWRPEYWGYGGTGGDAEAEFSYTGLKLGDIWEPFTSRYYNGLWDDVSNTEANQHHGISETPFIRRGDSAYVIVQGPTWEEAEANSVKLGGHLVTINDVAENQWISDTFRDRLAAPDKNLNNGLRSGSWIGLNDKAVDGIPKWSDGSEVTYTNFVDARSGIGTSGVFDGWLTVMLDPGGTVQKYAGLNSWHEGPATYLPGDTVYTTGIAEIKLLPNNIPTGTPTVTGTFKVGSTLTIDATTIQDSDNFTGYTPTFKYNWETSTDGTTWSKLTSTDGADNNNTYILTAAEVSKKIRGVVSYLDGYGTNEVVNSVVSTIEADTKKPIIRGNSLYTIVDGPSWTQAEANSVKLGGHLTTINNLEENNWITSIIKSVGNAYTSNAWIGFSDAREEGSWSWSSGEISSFTNWGNTGFGNEPNGGVNENFGMIYLDLPLTPTDQWGKWNDADGLGRVGGGISETPFIRRGDSGYVIVSGPTWEEAEANAVKLGGHLVTINDAAENEWITLTLLTGKGATSSDLEAFYIGLTDNQLEGEWKWISGETSTYRNWYWINPNNSGEEDNAEIYSMNTEWVDYTGGLENIGKWNDAPNNNGRRYGIAEIKLAFNNTPTGIPTVTGTFKVGSTLTIDATAIKDSDNFTGYTPTFKYNWETSTNGTTWSKLTTTDAADNNNTYILTAAEASKKIRGVVSYLDGYGTNEVVNSTTSIAIETVTPTYTLTSSLATINEGAVLTSTVTTTNVATGAKLYYALSGTGITTADFSAGALTGEGVTDATGQFAFTHTLANDLTTEGAETLSIKLYSDAARTLQVGSTASVSIADTSLTQVVKDTTPPAIALTTSKASLTAGEQATITFTLSEDSTDFTASDITTSSAGTLSDFKGSGKIYTASFTPKPNTTAASVVAVANKSFSDAAGNFNNDEVEANNKITFFIDTVVAPGVKITLPGDLTTDENGKSVVIPLVLKTEPKAAVRLDFLLSKGAEATLSTKSFEFSTANWSTPQTLTLKGIEDYVDDIDQKYSLTITGNSIDKSYQTSTDLKGLNIPLINLINLDDGEDEGADIYGDPGAKPTKDTLNGTEGPDRIYGAFADDILYGGPGKDLIFGGYGNDILYGEISDDELYGQDEDDTLYGGDGNDRLTGGEGFDKLIGGAGNDTYVIDDERDTIDDQGLDADIDTVLFRANLTTYTMPASIKNAVLDSGSAFKLIGNGLDNNLKGNDNNNEIDGGDGSDVLNGGGGDDLLKGGSGSDTAHYHKQLPGFTFGAEGGAGITANLLTGKASGTEIGNDTLVAIENIETSDGSDTLIGNENANTLIANGGNDLLEANGGNDLLIGGQGDDLLDGGAGDDQAVYSGVRDDYEVSQDSTGTKVIIKDKRQFQDGIDTITGIETFKFADKSLVLADLTSKTLDFNGDGNVDSFDSILMMRHMMGTYPGESIKKDIPGKFDLTAIQRKLTNAFADTFSLNGGLRLDIDGDKRISAFRDGMMITQHIHKQGIYDSPSPPGFNPPAGFPAQMQQHLKDLIGF